LSDDEKKISRTAQPLFVQYKKGWGSPPAYEAKWTNLFEAKVETVIENVNATPAEASFWIPNERWNADIDFMKGDLVRIIYYEDEQEVVLFQGFLTKISRQFSGGNEKGGKYERLAYICLDYRWLMHSISPCFGQIGRSLDDYNDDTPISGSYTFFSGRRCIFNEKGVPNCDPEELGLGGNAYPIFANPNINNAIAWTAYDIVRYILLMFRLYADDYFPVGDPDNIIGLEHADWQQKLNNIVVEGLNTATALQFICKQIGWAYRIDYADNEPLLIFFKSGSANSTSRSDLSPIIRQSLFSPPSADIDPANANIKAAVAAGKTILWAAQFEDDISNVVNSPLYFGSPHKIEFTAELVPAWRDDDLVPDTSDDNSKLFFTESDLAEIEDPNQYSFYKYYHLKGNSLKRSVGRLWCLNESGKYTIPSYDRGEPFDWGLVIPPKYAFDKYGARLYGLFNRQLLPCLTKDNLTDNSVGIAVEFSFDEGASWHKLSASIINVDGECGIYITEPNLAEIKLKNNVAISDGDLEDMELNYWTSLCRDKLAGNSFKLGEWKTRIRVTASVQMDQRVGGQLSPSNSGSPFYQVEIFDLSGDYHAQARDESSIYSATSLNADERDDSIKFYNYMQKLRDSLQDSSISGQFTTERLWLNRIKIGDVISEIEGRGFQLKTGLGWTTLCPEIIQIIYMVQQQRMKLITRDLKFSEKR